MAIFGLKKVRKNFISLAEEDCEILKRNIIKFVTSVEFDKGKKIRGTDKFSFHVGNYEGMEMSLGILVSPEYFRKHGRMKTDSMGNVRYCKYNVDEKHELGHMSGIFSCINHLCNTEREVINNTVYLIEKNLFEDNFMKKTMSMKVVDVRG